MPRGNEKNLIPNSKRTPEQLREQTKKGGIASGIVRSEKSTARKVAQMVLSGKIPECEIKTAVRQMGLPETEQNMQSAIIAGQALSAANGNEKAARLVLELAGETTDGIAAERGNIYKGIPGDMLGNLFVDPYRYILNRKYSDYDFEGGRGSLKSSFCGLIVIDQIERNSKFCALAVRQLKDNLRDSVYEQIVWSIDMLDLSADYKCTVSPMMITKISTGQKIFFRGGDDPQKIKSIKPPKDMHIGVVWIEEADQLNGDEALRNIKQSAFRGGNDGILLRSYNVPRSQQHFINREKIKPNPKRLIHHSHFKDAPPEWLGQRFLDDAELLKQLNPNAYAHEYDGLAVGNGYNVFENIKDETITDETIKTFDRVLNGVDWGWYPDPWAFVRMQFHAGSRTLYIFDESVENKKGNRETAQIIKNKGLTSSDRITADSAEPKSIDNYKEFGLNRTVGAEKGPGSLDFSFKWLASLNAIVIDKKRCPKTYTEFVEYEYQRDKNGDVISAYPDKNNHCIDAVRYGTEDIWKNRENRRKYYGEQ